ncbi:cobalamin biosynthesis protein [Streptomyces yaizuensis]|uniref:Cobalamin biosynthesis protein n=1 Tax=Streptomyces yaizuensis TaxID=2989713 RepID=A0ABQ5P7V6_9ACTN|nr:cobalamin biosynthesis protein [Streptomyces sp. YSPA8]GLF98670.1 cobalamin biosynthesis protein [Streptomyces sp. YSPA8]
MPFGPGEAVLRPPSLVVGVGGARGVSADEIVELVVTALAAAGLSVLSVAEVATAAAKAREPGIVAAARRLAVPLVTHPAERLAAVPVPHPSGAVLRALGTASVAEAAALAGGGELLVPKRKSAPLGRPARATCAVARRPGAAAGGGLPGAGRPGGDPFWIGLSDGFPPWDLQRARLRAVAATGADLTLLNPFDLQGEQRLGRILALLQEERPPCTPVRIIENASRTGESSRVTVLAGVDPALVDMMSVVTVGTSATRAIAGRAATPPGHRWQA